MVRHKPFFPLLQNNNHIYWVALAIFAHDIQNSNISSRGLIIYMSTSPQINGKWLYVKLQYNSNAPLTWSEACFCESIHSFRFLHSEHFLTALNQKCGFNCVIPLFTTVISIISERGSVFPFQKFEISPKLVWVLSRWANFLSKYFGSDFGKIFRSHFMVPTFCTPEQTLHWFGNMLMLANGTEEIDSFLALQFWV